LILGIVFVISLFVRLIGFRENVYFGFDEARDAFTSQEIYTKGDLKLIGPPAGSGAGIFHGPLYWYLVGPVYLVAKGNPEIVALIFKLINALAVIPIYLIATSLFTPQVGIMSAIVFAFSFEQNQYASYVGNPTLALYPILMLFGSVALLIGKKIDTNKSLLLMVAGAAIATQLNLMYVYLFAVIGALVFFFRKEFKLESKAVIRSVFLGGVILSTYILAEVRGNFSRIKQVLNLFRLGYNEGEPLIQRIGAYLEKCGWMVRDNIFTFSGNQMIFVLIFGLIAGLFVVKSMKSPGFKLLLVWVFAWVLLLPLGVHRGYYATLGLSVGLIIGISAVLIESWKKGNKLIVSILLIVVFLSNIFSILEQNGNSLILPLKPQPMMKLADELRLIDIMYKTAEGSGFTVRLVGIPFRVQTVWAYLFRQYGQEKYGYLPFWEYGNVGEYPGRMPIPIEGTSCKRFLVIEPTRGLPINLIESAAVEESYFSKRVDSKYVGDFFIEERLAYDKNCHETQGELINP